MRKPRVKNGHIGKSLFRSYLLVALVIVLLDMIIFVYFSGSAQTDSEQRQRVESEKVAIEVDRVLNEAATQTIMMSNNTLVSRLLSVRIRDSYWGEDALAARDLMSAFREVMDYYDSITWMALYDLRQQSLITNENVLHGAFATDHLSGTYQIGEDLLQRAAANERVGLYVTEPQSQNYRLYYVSNIYSGSYSAPSAIMIAQISRPLVERALDLYGYDEARYHLVSSRFGSLGGAASRAEMLEDIAPNITGDEIVRQAWSNATLFVYRSHQSTMPDLYYCYISPATEYYSALISALLIMGLFTATIVLVVVYLARRFEKTNTAPLKRMLSAVNPDADIDKDLTYVNMENSISRMAEKMGDLESFWKNDYAALIMSGQETSEKRITQYMDSHSIHSEHGFRVLSVRLQSDIDEADTKMMQFCIGNVFGELLAPIRVGAPVKSWDSVDFILRDQANLLGEYAGLIGQGTAFLYQHFAFYMYLGLSDNFTAYTQMWQAKQQAEYAVEYAELSGSENEIALYSAINEHTQTDKNYNEKLHRLTKALLARKYPECLAVLEDIWRNNIQAGNLHANVSKGRMLAILSIIAVSYKEGSGRLDIGKVTQTNRLRDLYQVAVDMLEDLQAEKSSERAGKKTMAKICAYVQEHYNDTELNASMICLHFDLSNSYVSKLFKAHTGEGLLDHIHQVRIGHAKEHLRQGKSVQETAALTGYTDARGLIRAFKRYEGVTPGQYR